MYHEMFPEEVIALQEEIQKHQTLLIHLLQLPKDSSIEMKLGEVAAYCGVILDGDYSQADLYKLCEILVRKLRATRGELIVIGANSKSLLLH